MHILVTGAGGFVCRSIIDVLLTHDYEIVAVDRAFDAPLRQRWANRVEMIEADVASISHISCDSFIHGAALTASPEESGMSPEANLRANLDPVFEMLKLETKRGIFFSSSAVYRESEPGQAITEETPPTPLGMYAVAKRTIETLIESLKTLHNRDLTVIRLGSIYGPEERSRETRPRVSPVGRMVNEALNKGTITLTQADESRGWTFAPDIGEAVHVLLQKPTLDHALYNIASGQVLTAREAAAVIQSHLPYVEITEQPDTNAPIYRKGYLSSKRLQKETGFSAWTPFSNGIAQIIRES